MKNILELILTLFLIVSFSVKKIHSQKLDIEGIIKVGNENIDSIAGMIRWNQSTLDFEGFDGQLWKSLTNDANPIEGECEFDDSNGSQSFQINLFTATTSTTFPQDRLLIQFINGANTGAFILGDNYETCNECVLINTSCTLNACLKIFLAESGTLTITSTNSPFEGYLSNVKLREVTIDPFTFVSTPVPGGEELCIDLYLFSVP